MHGHAHHNHARNAEELEERGNIEERGDVVIVYKTIAPDFEGEVGGYVTGVQQTTTTAAHAGVGAPVSASTRTKEQTTETKATDEATTTKAKEESTTTKETVAHTTHETKAETTETTETTQTTKAETTDKKRVI